MRKTAVFLGVTLAALTVSPLSGQLAPGQQGPPPSAGMVIKGKAPVSNDVLKVKLPKPQEATLANGLRLMVLEDHRLPRVSFQILIPGAGGYYDPAPMIGLSTYAAQMMREGTKTKSSQQISQELETMAAGVNVGSGASGTMATVSGGALTENVGRLFDLTADILLNPSFPQEEWDRLKTRARTGLIQQRTQPGFLSQERFSKVVFGDHPAGRISATPETLDAITRDAMVEYHRTRFVPDHALIAFAGDITLADARKLVDTKLGAWKKAGVPKPAVTDPPPAGPAKVYLVGRPSSVQTSLTVGTQSMTRTDPDYVPLTVANRVLGGAMGRLFRHLREEKGYTYGVGSSFSATTVQRAVVGVDERADGRHRSGARRPDAGNRDHAHDARSREGAERREARDRRGLCAVAREPGPDARLLRAELDLQPAGRLLGYVPGEDQRRDCRAGAGGGREVLRSREAADRGGRRCRQDHRHHAEAGHARDLRRRRQTC